MRRTTASEHVPAARVRRARRARATLVMVTAATLLWASLAFLQTSGEASTSVDVTPGTTATGIADVVALAGTVTAPNGAAQLQQGVKVARIDVASTFHANIRVGLHWLNAPGFSRQTQTGGWQLRFGIYYPVHTGACTGTAADDTNHAVTVTLSGAEETFAGTAEEIFCAYRSLTTGDSGIVTSGDHQGTRLLALDRLNGTLAPKQALTKAACGPTGAVYCTPTGLHEHRHTYFIVASLVNPGGTVPPGQTPDGLEIEVDVMKDRRE